MEVVVNGQLATSADGAWLRPFVQGAGGKFIEQPRLKDPTLLSRSIGGAVIFQAVSVIVAQKHLADISHKLSELLGGLDQIREFLEAERRSAVLAIVDALRQRILVIQEGQIDDRWLSQLDANDQELTGIQNHLLEEIQAMKAVLSKVPSRTWLSAGAMKQEGETREKFERAYRLVDEWTMATEARVAGWAMLSAYPKTYPLRRARLVAIEESIGNLLGDGNVVDQLGPEIEKSIEKVRGLFGDRLRKTESNHRKRTLAEGKSALLDRIGGTRRVIATRIEETSRLNRADEAPLRLALRFDAGKIVEALELPSSSHEDSRVTGSAVQ